jgi:geranylgeranyl diphosphate synthase type II
VDARAYLAERGPLVEAALDAALPPAEAPPRTLHAAMRHLVFPGGKRLRPALALAAAEAVGSAPESALPVAVAVELVHTYSLVHDDLPCIDDALRRGRPTVHVAFGEAAAVLAGDALLAAGFAALAGEPGAPSSERRLAALRELAAAAGSHALVGGQLDDLVFDPRAGDAASVESIHERKSAALLTAAIAGGAWLGGAAPDRVARLRRFGRAVGVAFQIADDLLDAGAESSGASLVALVGQGRARERAEELLAAGLTEIDDLGERAEPLRALARFAVRRDA